MSRPVLKQWSGDELVYLAARKICRSFGYPGPGERTDTTPSELAHIAAIKARIPLHDAEPNREAELFDPREAAEEVKRVARELGAHSVGVTAVDRKYVYAGADVPHQFAILVGVAMDYEEILALPGPETNAEYLRAYDEASRIAVGLASMIRQRGHPARTHTLLDEGIAMIPHAQAAGLGTLGKHGSLINGELGCSFRLSAVTTDLPLAVDAPRAEGVEEFCAGCKMCVTYCPGGAISHDRDVVRGAERWIVDTEACVPYVSAHYACGVCIQVCPLNAKAFEGAYQDEYVRTVRELDPAELRSRLTGALSEPWSFVDPERA